MSAAANTGHECIGELSHEAAEGRHLPTLRELLRGCALFREDVRSDAAEFANRAMESLDVENGAVHELLFALNDLTILPREEHFVAAAEAFTALECWPGLDALQRLDGAARCHFYAALKGVHPSVHKVAGFAVGLAYSPGLTDAEASDYVSAAVAWLLAANGQTAPPIAWTREAALEFLGTPRRGGPGEHMVEKMLANRSALLGSSSTPKSADQPARRSDTAQPFVQHEYSEEEEPEENASSDERSLESLDAPAAVVFTAVGNPQTSGGQNLLRDFKELLGTPLPLAPVPNLIELRRSLLTEFPYADRVCNAILADLVGRPHVALTPVVLVGPPGCGKTSFAVRLTQLLGLPFEVFGCGGVADAAFAGTARRWHTSGPSLPVALIRAHRHASPAIILDEAEKAGTSRTNGRLTDSLLGMLEPGTACRWRDPHLEAAVDLSNVVWLATANTMKGLPRPLRDRCRILDFPMPGPEHLAILANRILANTTSRRGLHPQWASPLDGIELSALARAWTGGSLRRLAKLVNGVVAAREQPDARH
ncbi:AAA family ATPase [Belnapia sp. F-4-1]|uniref:AAA family ATPase n=1 Tax=Belnapia sp. F-4-1 TaxID=1545443 RepID=UPI0009DD6810|nr:AAA family ATPase [Belnapia sp. F-4-1]